MKLKQINVLFGLSLFFSASIYSTASFSEAHKALHSEKVHQVTTLEVIDKLKKRHYNELEINDALSEQALNSFLQSVDPNRQVLLAKEVEKFKSSYATKLDELIQRGEVYPAYEIFNTYHQRMLKLLAKEIESIEQTIKSFDFSKDDKIQIDRSEAPWPADENEVKRLFELRLKAAVLSQRLSDKDDDKIIELLSKRYSNQLERLKRLNNEDVYQMYMNAFTKQYDPYTNYLSPVSSENFDISMSLKLEGIGAMLSTEDEFTKVVRLIHAGPAWKQGELKPSDRITGVAQGDEEMVDVVGWRLDEVVKLIRGPKDSTVQLELIPAKAVSDDERKTISIVRDEVKLEEQSVQKAMIQLKDENGIERKFGILDIPTFYIDFEALRKRDPYYRSTTRDTAKLLTELVEEGAEGIIIDLRNNGGGSLREANELTGLFIEKGPSVQIQLSDKRVYTEAKRVFSPYYEGPIVILINRMSASASEIFAAAMQDYGRGLIIGSQSFGKGTVQSLIPMNHGKLKVTESKFYRISGDSTQLHGVKPDITLPNIYDNSVIGESANEHAMQWDSIRPAKYLAVNSTNKSLPLLQNLSADRVSKQADFIYYNEKRAYEDSLDLEYLSLNEKERKDFRASDKQARLAIENKLRKAQGKKVLKDFEELEAEIEAEAEKENSEEPLQRIDTDDAFLQESANILLDLVQLK